jgi:malate dehydrogenase
MVKATVCGAAGEQSFPSEYRRELIYLGGIGQPLSLLLKLNPLITELSLYDVVNAVGVSNMMTMVQI